MATPALTCAAPPPTHSSAETASSNAHGSRRPFAMAIAVFAFLYTNLTSFRFEVIHRLCAAWLFGRRCTDGATSIVEACSERLGSHIAHDDEDASSSLVVYGQAVRDVVMKALSTDKARLLCAGVATLV